MKYNLVEIKIYNLSFLYLNYWWMEILFYVIHKKLHIFRLLTKHVGQVPKYWLRVL